ncbi:hypothetical protein ACQU0X_09845 [Pseudovibrio ascidiaceicola]|uniref:hypothetical protein n=1 Tax=Pseudovibrio ascidiaceicola TaxID=285279 RepID=UPI003D36329C
MARPGGVKRVIGIPDQPVNTQTPKKQNNLTKTKIQTIQQLHISTQTQPPNTPKPQKQANNTKPKQQKLTNPKFAQTLGKHTHQSRPPQNTQNLANKERP